MRKVTERDFRKEEFKDKSIEDYEFRADGEIVRKDRWEMGIRIIQSKVLPNVDDFEIEDVITEITKLIKENNRD